MEDKPIIELADLSDNPWMDGIEVLQRDSGRYLLIEPALGTYRCYDVERDLLGSSRSLAKVERGGDLRILYADEAAAVIRAAAFAEIRIDSTRYGDAAGIVEGGLAKPYDGWYDSWPDLYELDEPLGMSSFSIGGYNGPSFHVAWGFTRLVLRQTWGGQPRARIVRRLRAEDLRRFWDGVDEAGVGVWADDYKAPSILDGTSWSMRLTWRSGLVKETGGANAYPERFEAFLRALSALTGGVDVR